MAQDTTKVRIPELEVSGVLIPVLYYSPQTSWAFGISGSKYFIESQKDGKVSSLHGMLVYTRNEQFVASILPKFYLNNNSVFFSGSISYEKFPTRFWGIGNNNKVDNFERYTPAIFNTQFTVQKSITKNVLLGGQFWYRNERLLSENSEIDLVNSNIDGYETYSILGLGAVATYDTRNFQYYPDKGEFVKFSFIAASELVGSDYEFVRTRLDARKYYALTGKTILAAQFWSDNVFGDQPFQILPKIGGLDVMRGYFNGRFRDKHAHALQFELRQHMWKQLYGTLFMNAGKVSNTYLSNFFANYHYAGGGGFRYRINSARVHLRFDVALNKEGNTEFYFTASEAF